LKRKPIDAPKFKDYILPLLFYKRLCDVYEDEIRKLSKEFENEQFAKEIIKEIAKENPKLARVIDIKDFNETSAGQRVISDEALARLIEILNKHRLGFLFSIVRSLPMPYEK